MARSHPPALIKTVERVLREQCGLRAGAGVLVAVSGGGDSSALLHVLAHLAPTLGIRLAAHGVDHGLRMEAGRELDLAEALSGDLGITFTRSRVSLRSGSNLQARARTARYRALRRAAAEQRLDFLATGHHADDRAETVLIRMLRGSSAAGLAVLGPRDQDVLHPLCRSRRSELVQHLSRHGIAYASDPSNRDPRYLRTLVRHEILPAMARQSPAIVEHLCGLADEMAELRKGASNHPLALGRRQRELFERALENRQWGFELPLSGGGVLRLQKAVARHRVAGHLLAKSPKETDPPT